jgi:hypothetical protein
MAVKNWPSFENVSSGWSTASGTKSNAVYIAVAIDSTAVY